MTVVLRHLKRGQPRVDRISANEHGESYEELRYVRWRDLSAVRLRAAIAQVVNAVLAARLPAIRGEGTCATTAPAR